MSDAGTRVRHAFGLNARNQVLMCTVPGAVALGIALVFVPWQAALIIGWDTTALAWMAWTVGRALPLNAPSTRRVAAMEDDSRAARDFMLLGASLASLIGVVLVLLKAANEKGDTRTILTALGAATVVASWATVHLLFTLRYAALYYGGDEGIDFHDNSEPDYLDFTYMAFTIGMTYQVSDTDLTSRSIRRTALRHALLSYVFGTASVAVTINVVAGLLTK
jgi:uncharacterized membrane protein